MSIKVLFSIVGETSFNSGESNSDERQRNHIRGEIFEIKTDGYLTLKRFREYMYTLSKYLKVIPSFTNTYLSELSDQQTQRMVNKLWHIKILDYLKPTLKNVK